jgi:hypothetical protein
LYNFIFVPKPSGHHPRFETYMNPFLCHGQPLLENTLQPQHTTSNHTKESNKMCVSDDTSSAASIVAAINDSNDDRQEQVSDIVHDMTKDNDDNVSNNDASNNNNKKTDAGVFFSGTGEIMNQSNKKIGKTAIEER